MAEKLVVVLSISLSISCIVTEHYTQMKIHLLVQNSRASAVRFMNQRAIRKKNKKNGTLQLLCILYLSVHPGKVSISDIYGVGSKLSKNPLWNCAGIASIAVMKMLYIRSVGLSLSL
ncbi:Homoserine kinase [Forsythia ovata]|uniref:Homoserine kinase n=1 Tax=Forsythia ovata TaxID=205694 RepID=A0ABD1WI38_9LAMI